MSKLVAWISPVSKSTRIKSKRPGWSGGRETVTITSGCHKAVHPSRGHKKTRHVVPVPQQRRLVCVLLALLRRGTAVSTTYSSRRYTWIAECTGKHEALTSRGIL